MKYDILLTFKGVVFVLTPHAAAYFSLVTQSVCLCVCVCPFSTEINNNEYDPSVGCPSQWMIQL